jgi:peptide/nickel transport system ATP-binding protein
MYAGRIVEQGPIDAVLDAPAHPYTVGLIGSVPSRNRRGGRLFQIPGMTPSLLNIEPGCTFRTRCPRASAACLEEPPVVAASQGREVRCFNPHEGPLEEAIQAAQPDVTAREARP